MAIDEAVQSYIDGIDSAFRPLFDRMHRLIVAAYPDVEVVLSFGIPTYKIGKRRLYVGVWQHGLSIYGWPQGSADDFIGRHPKLRTSKGTIRLRSEDAAGIPDEELAKLIKAALGE